jgi:hypothetical protein
MKQILKGSLYEKLLLLFLTCGSVIFYGLFYEQHLIQKEQLQLFEVTFQYFINKIGRPGGLADYLGEFFIQFFRIPFAGALIITILCLLLGKLTKNLLQREGEKKPLLLFIFLPVTGYWILLTNEFYSLSGLMGLLLSIAGVIIYSGIKNKLKRSITGIILLVSIYWFTGAAYLVFASILIVSELIKRFGRGEKKDPVITGVIFLYLMLAVLLPFFTRWFIIKETLMQAFISESYYKIGIFFPLPLILIFISFPLFVILQHLLGNIFSDIQSRNINIVSSLIILITMGAGLSHFADFSAEREMFYENMVNKKDWQEIINKAESEQPYDRKSMVAVNLALAETGELSSKMFMFNQGENFLFAEYSNRGMTPFITGEPFYYLGFYNFAQMFAMETIESTPDVKYPSRSFKRVAETYIINGQYGIARKFLVPLSHTIFYGKWAKETLTLIGNKDKADADPYWNSLRELKSGYDFYYNARKLDIALRYLLLSNRNNKLAYEYIMACYLLNKDFDGFLLYLPLARQLNYSELPLSWQEACVYIGTRLKELPPQIGSYSIDDKVIERIKKYSQLFSEIPRDTLKIKQEFGNSYWYYLHFK